MFWVYLGEFILLIDQCFSDTITDILNSIFPLFITLKYNYCFFILNLDPVTVKL